MRAIFPSHLIPSLRGISNKGAIHRSQISLEGFLPTSHFLLGYRQKINLHLSIYNLNIKKSLLGRLIRLQKVEKTILCL